MTRAAIMLALLLLGCRPKSADPCRVSPSPLDFGEVQARLGAVHERFITVVNPSSEDRFVTALPLAFPFAAPDSPVLVPARSNELISIRFAAIDSLLHLDELVLDGGEACQFTIPVRALGSGLVRVSQEPIEFTLGAGEVETKQVLVENTRRTETTVQLQWLDPGFPASVPASLSLPASSSTLVSITAAPPGWERVASELRFLAPGQGTSVKVAINPSSPRLEITPLSIDIPVVGLNPDSQPPAFAERSIRIRNTGASGDPSAPRLRVVANDPFFGNPDELHISTPPLPVDLAEGDSAELKVRVIPRFEGLKTFGVMISTDRFGPSQVRLSTTAELLPPCTLERSPADALELHAVADGGLEGDVRFTNVGTGRCIVDNLRLNAPQFRLASGGQSQVEIANGRTHHVTIAGPRVDAGVAGAFGFHVFRTNGDDEWLELRAP